MTVDFDISQYLNIFLDEAEEQIQILDETLVLLEQEGENQDLLNKIFRAAHTLKGSSASMGFENMAQLTHAMEGVLDDLRHGELSVTSDIIDHLLQSLDALKELKNNISAGQDNGVDVAPLIANLKNVKNQVAAAAVAETIPSPEVVAGEEPEVITKPAETLSGADLGMDDVEINVAAAAKANGYNVWHAKVTLSHDCLMKGARAYIVFNNIKDLGEVIKTIPPIDEIEEERFEDSFEFVLVTKSGADTLIDTVKSISEIAAVEVQPVNVSLVAQSVSQTAKEDRELKPVAAGAPKGNGAQTQAQPKTSQTVRVDVQRLENLMNLVGELVIDRTRLADVNGGLKAKLGAEELLETLEEVTVHVGRIIGDLQEEIMKARMFPIEQVFNRFPRMVRDLAQKAGKEINFVIEGRETELDRTVIEEIGDPLIHLLRNAIDHGIETPENRVKAGKPSTGTINLRAFHQENQIVITVQDDGKGMDPEVLKAKAIEKGVITADVAARLTDREAVNLIFAPGFSTAATVSDVSGRGVGMDIVRAHIEKINGIVEIDSTPGEGTKFTIKLPLTLAINRSLMVYLGGQVFAFPLANVVEIINVDLNEIQKVQQRDVVLVRGEVLPLFKLSEVLDYPSDNQGSTKLPVVVVGISEKRIGFIVDELMGEQEIVIKSLGEFIGQIPGLAGATIMGDGKVALILDVRGLAGQAGV
ncbi:MAG: chemotaxis protein CheA [Clostridia bacterium]|nr:chemotaxis protein CheA [Clostridia bacterium]